MTKTTHTHKGHCQACGRLQAVNNVTRHVAKHGYTVDFGYFNGVCFGAHGYKPAELDVSLTHVTIRNCTELAKQHDARVAGVKNGTIVPETFERWNPEKVVVRRMRHGEPRTTGGYDTLPLSVATESERKYRILGEIRHYEDQAKGLRDHVAFLVKTILPMFGRSLPSVAELNVKVVPAPTPTVDVKAAKVIGTFATKQARKDALNSLNRAYEKAHEELRNLYLAMPHSARTPAKTEVYYGPQQLNHWRAKHSAAALKEFPQAASIVTDIENLVKAREAVKATP